MNHPLVSIVIPAYNAAKYIVQTIESVIEQTFPDWELWIIDDGSTDDTASVVTPFLADARIHYVYQKNQERSAARNHGIRRSNGSYVAFLDADDLWLPTKLERQVALMERRQNVGLCFTRYRSLDRSTAQGVPTNFDPTADNFRRLLEESNFIAPSAAMVRRDVFEIVGLFDELLPVYGCEDWDMWLRIARQYHLAMVVEPILVLYRNHIDNTSNDKLRRSGQAVLRQTLADPTLPPAITKNSAGIWAGFHFRSSRSHSLHGQKRAAFQAWCRAVMFSPSGPVKLAVGRKATMELFTPAQAVRQFPKLKQRLLKARQQR